VLAVASIVNATPTAPSLPAELHVPPIDIRFTISPPASFGTDVMPWVRDVEYLLFVVALAWSTYKVVDAFGVN
jgi:hypothetical protein